MMSEQKPVENDDLKQEITGSDQEDDGLPF